MSLSYTSSPLSQVLISSGMLDPIQAAQLEQLTQRVEEAASLARDQDDLLEGVEVINALYSDS